MKSKIIAAVIAAAWLLGPAAQAADFTPTPNASYVVDLDTPDSSMSMWQLDDLTGINALRTRGTFVRIGKKTQYGPVVTIVLSNATSETRMTFILTPKASIAMLSAERGDTELGRELFMAPIEPKENFGLEIDWTPRGEVEARLYTKGAKDMGGQGFERHEVAMDGAPTQIQILGGGGEVEFKPLALGVVR